MLFLVRFPYHLSLMKDDVLAQPKISMDCLCQVRDTFVTKMLRNELYAMSYTCLADLLYPRKLRRSAGTYIPYLTQSVMVH